MNNKISLEVNNDSKTFAIPDNKPVDLFNYLIDNGIFIHSLDFNYPTTNISNIYRQTFNYGGIGSGLIKIKIQKRDGYFIEMDFPTFDINNKNNLDKLIMVLKPLIELDNWE